MDKENEQFAKVRILADLPKFKERYTPDEDAFLHKTYADTILEIVTNKENKPPLSIGLFGSWGIGKSSIINIIRNKISDDIRLVYFNAWKYSEDSFRRQFLLESAKQLFDNKDEKNKKKEKLQNLFHKELPMDKQESLIQSMLDHFSRFKEKPIFLVKLLFQAIATALLIWALIHFEIPSPVIAIITAVIIFLLTKYMPDTVLQINIPIETDPKLIFPEQFEDEFYKLLNPESKYPKACAALKNKKFFVIIDDVDRCYSNTIITILNSVKTFLTERSGKCYFLTALDDDSVLDILKEKNKQYQYEELMKFFDVAIRVNPLMGPDLIRFSNRIVEEMKGSYHYGEKLVDIVQICIYGGFQNARQIKYFLNSFQAKLFIAHKRFLEHDFSKDPNEILEQLAKFTVIEEKYPDIARDIIQNPELLSQLQDKSGSPTANKNETVDQVDKIFKKFPDFKKFLWETREIYIENIEWLSFLKISKYESQLPQISKLRNAVLGFEEEALKEILKDITDQPRKEALVGFLSEKMQSARSIQLGNVVDSSLWIIKNFNFEIPKFKKKLAENICKNYIIPENKLFERDVALLFETIQLSSKPHFWVEKIKDMGVKELITLNIPEYVDKIGLFLNFIYEKNQVNKNIASSINTKFLEWHKEHLDRMLNILDSLRSSKELNAQRKEKSIQIPDNEMLKALISSIGLEDENLDVNGQIRRILYKFWDGSLIDPLSQKMDMIISKQSTKNVLDGALKFALETLLDMVSLDSYLAESQSLAIAQHTWNFYSRCTQREGKLTALKAMLIATYTIPSQHQVDQNTFRQNFLNQIQIFTEGETKGMYNFIRQKPIDWWEKLLKDYIIQNFQIIQQKKSDPAYCIPRLNFIWGRARGVVTFEKFYGFFISLLNPQTVNDNSLREWSKILEVYVPKLKSDLRNNYIDELQRNSENMQINISLERRKIYSNLALFLVTNQSADKQLEISTKYLSYLKNSSNILQTIGAEFLPKVIRILSSKDFKLYFNNVAKEIFQKPVSGIIQYKVSISRILEFDKYLDKKSVDSISNALQQCFDVNQQPPIKDFGAELILKANKLSEQAEITRAIVNLAKTSKNSGKKKWEDLLNKKKNLLDKKQIEIYFQNA